MHTSIPGPFPPLDGWNALFLRESLKGKYWSKKKLPTTLPRPRKIQPRTSIVEWSETITHDACGGEILAGNSDKQLLLAVTQLARCKCISAQSFMHVDRQAAVACTKNVLVLGIRMMTRRNDAIISKLRDYRRITTRYIIPFGVRVWYPRYNLNIHIIRDIHNTKNIHTNCIY